MSSDLTEVLTTATPHCLTSRATLPSSSRLVNFSDVIPAVTPLILFFTSVLSTSLTPSITPVLHTGYSVLISLFSYVATQQDLKLIKGFPNNLSNELWRGCIRVD